MTREEGAQQAVADHGAAAVSGIAQDLHGTDDESDDEARGQVVADQRGDQVGVHDGSSG
jgi:hypothetical protein